MRDRSLAFLVPGDLQSATGGYGYDRRIIAGLRELGWQVEHRELDGSFPFPHAAALEHADAVLSTVPDGGLAMIDGLALGAMPVVAARHGERVRLVALIHHPLAEETGLSPEAAHRLKESERAALRWARHVVVTSEPTARALAAYDVDSARISVVVPGTDEAPLAHGSRSDVMHLLCVATLTARKGHELLIDSLATLTSLPWKLTCVGSLTRSPETVEALRQQLRRTALEERVELIGELTGHALEAAFQSADLFVLATFHEGYGMVVAEALARGVPVIGTATGAIPELVARDAGLVVPPGDGAAFRDALARVLGDRALFASLREGARRARDALPRWADSSAQMSAILERVVHS